MLENVLKNACEAARPGAPLRVEVTAVRSGPNEVTLRVADDGKGAAPGVLSSAFAPWFSTKKGKLHATGNHGLGLSIARKYVELCRGEIHLASPGPGLGATVTITLPIDQDLVEDPL